MKTCTLLTLALAAASTPLLGQTLPTPIFQDDFNTPGTPDASKWNIYRASGTGAPIGPQKYIEVTADNSPFGSENSSYLRIHHETGAGGLWIANTALPANQVLTVAFDFYMPSQTAWGETNDGLDPRVRLGSGGDPIASNTNRVNQELHFNDGGTGLINQQTRSDESPIFNTNTPYSIIYIYNHSADSITYTTYTNSERSVESGHYDVWLNGSLAIDGQSDSGDVGRAIGTDMTSIAFGAIGRQTEFYIDNFAVYAGAIPEPSTYALGAGLLALGAAAFWRRRRVA